MTPVVITSTDQPLHRAYPGACLNGWMALLSQEEADRGPLFATPDRIRDHAWTEWSRAQSQGLVVQ